MPRTSNKQEEILQYIDRFVAENGYPPSVREIGAAVGLRSTASVSYHLNHLQAKGLVAYEAGKKRALSMPNAKPGQIPIIGVVTAGLPILAVENQEGTMSWDGDPGCFALRVRGDSMVGAAILDGASGRRGDGQALPLPAGPGLAPAGEPRLCADRCLCGKAFGPGEGSGEKLLTSGESAGPAFGSPCCLPVQSRWARDKIFGNREGAHGV